LTVSAPFSQVDFADGLSIQNTGYLYRSPAAARVSFALLQSRTLARCRGQAYPPLGDDGASAPPGYTDQFAYGVFTLVDNAIVQMQAYSDTPITASTRADVRQVNEQVTSRFAATAA
jgi:hypothetical protein